MYTYLYVCVCTKWHIPGIIIWENTPETATYAYTITYFEIYKMKEQTTEYTPLKKKWFLDSPNAAYFEDHARTCKWLVTPISKPWSKRPFGRGTSLVTGLTITMVIHHVSKFLGAHPPQLLPDFQLSYFSFSSGTAGSSGSRAKAFVPRA